MFYQVSSGVTSVKEPQVPAAVVVVNAACVGAFLSRAPSFTSQETEILSVILTKS